MRRGINIMNLFFFVLWWKSNIDNNSPILPPIIDIKSRVFSLMRHLFLQALTLSIRIKTKPNVFISIKYVLNIFI